MAELVLQARTLPEPLYRLIGAEKVRVQEDRDEIRLIPIKTIPVEKVNYCPFLGMYTDGKQTVDGFFERMRKDAELER
ncbi:MAG: hypothetical protein FWC73_01715 [Defluviitaleaceae bacterium]|nr:hypothetical protein [Defluviitaleaceae bacterium]